MGKKKKKKHGACVEKGQINRYVKSISEINLSLTEAKGPLAAESAAADPGVAVPSKLGTGQFRTAVAE